MLAGDYLAVQFLIDAEGVHQHFLHARQLLCDALAVQSRRKEEFAGTDWDLSRGEARIHSY